MNILHTETLKGWGGQQNKVLKECVALRQLSHHVTLICNPDSVIGKRFRKENFSVIEHKMNKKNWLETIPFFLKLIKKDEIDLIITHGSTDSWIGGVAARLSTRKPISLRERHNLFPIRSIPSKWLHHSLFSGILSISSVVTDYLKSIGVATEKIHLLPDSVNITEFTNKKPVLQSEYGIPDNAIVIGSFTSLRPEKGVWDLFKLCKSILHQPNIWFVFGGTKYPEIEKKIINNLKAEGYDTSRVIWTDFREDAAEVLASFDIFVHLTHSEGLGTVLLEAMASALPVVVWDMRPMSDLITHDYNGMCIPFGNHPIITESIQTLIQNRQLRTEMGNRGRDIVIQQYSDNRLKERLEKIINTTQQ